MEIMTTPELRRVAAWATKTERNRQVTEEFSQELDPEGWHLVVYRFLHNDVEWRCEIFAKMAGSNEPAHVWLDVPMNTKFTPVPKEVMNG